MSETLKHDTVFANYREEVFHVTGSNLKRRQASRCKHPYNVTKEFRILQKVSRFVLATSNFFFNCLTSRK